MDIKSMAQAMLANYVDATNSVIATQSCSKYPNHHKIGQALETGLTATFAAQRIIDTKGDMNSNSFLKAFMTAVNQQEEGDKSSSEVEGPPAWAQQLIDDNKAIKRKLKL